MKKSILYIIATVIVVAGVAGGVVLSLGIVPKNSSNQDSGNSTQKEGNSNPTNSSQSKIFNTGTSTGGQQGQSFYIKNFSFEKKEDFDRITIDFQGRGTNSGVPYFTINPVESTLSVIFSDTSDFDISRGQSIFNGEKNITVSGFVVSGVALSYPKDDSSIGVTIETNTAEFGYLVDEQNLKLVIDIK